MAAVERTSITPVEVVRAQVNKQQLDKSFALRAVGSAWARIAYGADLNAAQQRLETLEPGATPVQAYSTAYGDVPNAATVRAIDEMAKRGI